MKNVWKIQTFDGKLHASEKDALRYLDALYSNEMSRLAAKLCAYADGKHVRTMNWLDENMPALVAAAKIKNDMPLEKEPEE